MNIKKYTSWFHDGDLKEIHHNKKNNTMTIAMSSSQIIGWEEFDEKIELSNYRTIAGILHLEEIEDIRINDQPYHQILQKKYDDGEILDFEIQDNSLVILGVQWTNFASKPQETSYSKIIIKAKKVWWENIPSLGNTVI